MLTIYRRHLKACPHRDKGRAHRHCRCPLWVDGFVGAVEIRKALKLRDWQRAQEVARDMEIEGRASTQREELVTLEQAWERFEKDATARKLATVTIKKYSHFYKPMQAFAERKGIRFISEFNVDLLSEFRSEWPDGGLSALKKLERMRSFFRFAQSRGWIASNPAASLKAPKVTQRPTLPFSQDEVFKILDALDAYALRVGSIERAKRLRAFVLVLRYSGLRIGDAVQLSTDRMSGDRLKIYTQKTGVPVFAKLPGFVMHALNDIPLINGKFYFWTGKSGPHSINGKWQKRLLNLFRLAGVDGGHAHRFRDTFAVELLLAGVPMERVSVLLGHRSIRVTERHYSPWVRSRQEQLESDLARAWANDAVAQREAQGTPEVHAATTTSKRVTFQPLRLVGAPGIERRGTTKKLQVVENSKSTKRKVGRKTR